MDRHPLVYTYFSEREGRLNSIASYILSPLPDSIQVRIVKHREFLGFCTVGGICFVITGAINYLLKLTLFGHKPIVAFTVANLISTFVSYVLNRKWSFRARGGRRPQYEAILFFAINGIAIGVSDIPLAVSRYLLDLRVPAVSWTVQEASDFIAGMILGTLMGMVFRLWAYRKLVFPYEKAGHGIPVEPASPSTAVSGSIR